MSDDDDKPEIEYTHEEMLEVEEEVSKGLKVLEKGKLGSSAQQQKSALLTKRVEKLKVRAQREVGAHVRRAQPCTDHVGSDSRCAGHVDGPVQARHE
jgi:hypothetical protein